MILFAIICVVVLCSLARPRYYPRPYYGGFFGPIFEPRHHRPMHYGPMGGMNMRRGPGPMGGGHMGHLSGGPGGHGRRH